MKKRNLYLYTLILALSVLFGSSASAFAASKLVPAKVKTNAADSAKLTWKKVSGADRYVIYFQKCDKKPFRNKTKVLRKNVLSYTQKNLKKNSSYKFMVVAQKKSGGKYKTLAESKVLHAVMKSNKKYTNAKSVTVAPKSVVIDKGNTVTVKATIKKENTRKKLFEDSHVAKIRYASSNPDIASVTSKGIITANKVGKCKIYAIAANGVWTTVSVKVTPAKVVKVTEPAKPSESKTQATTQTKAAAETKPAESSTQTVVVEKETVIDRTSYRVTYQYVGDVPEGIKAPVDSKEYKEGDQVTVASKPSEVDGYTFKGWMGEEEVSGGMPKKDVTLIGYWVKKQEEPVRKYKITYQFLGDVPKGSEAPTDEKEYSAGEKVGIKGSPTMTGYTFSGWYGPNGRVDDDSMNMPAMDVTVAGYWTKNSHTITYQYTLNDDESKTPYTYRTVSYNYGDSITPINNFPEKSGYRFKGWEKELEVMPDEDIVVEGTMIKTYRITRVYVDEFKKIQKYDSEYFEKGTKLEYVTLTKYSDSSDLYSISDWKGFYGRSVDRNLIPLLTAEVLEEENMGHVTAGSTYFSNFLFPYNEINDDYLQSRFWPEANESQIEFGDYNEEDPYKSAEFQYIDPVTGEKVAVPFTIEGWNNIEGEENWKYPVVTFEVNCNMTLYEYAKPEQK